MLTLPPVPLPPVDELDASATDPLLPDVASPDLSVNEPLVPNPVSEMIENDPLLVTLPNPGINDTAPPVDDDVVLPLLSTTRPPTSTLEEEPTAMLTLPPVPPFECPLRTVIEPLFPASDSPVNTRIVPVESDSCVSTYVEPLSALPPDESAHPRVTDTEPPLADDNESPARTTIRPPVGVFDESATRTNTSPPLPELASDDCNVTEPLLPLVDVPVAIFSTPLVPEAPDVGVRIVNAPLVDAVLSPVSTRTLPPVLSIVAPARTTKRPPTPDELTDPT